MDWRDEGFVVSVRPHGESSAVLTVLTRDHGRHAGLVRGATSRRLRGVLQPGNRIAVEWRARLEEHLGNYNVEPLDGSAALLMLDAGKLAALSSACALIEASLPEREPHPGLCQSFGDLITGLSGETWPEAYVRWELAMLAEVGFGLDLASCAATGVVDDLLYVSPKSGRAVSRDAGSPYKDRLLPLPAFLRGEDIHVADTADILDGLRTTGHFLASFIEEFTGKPLPDPRRRLIERIARMSS